MTLLDASKRRSCRVLVVACEIDRSATLFYVGSHEAVGQKWQTPVNLAAACSIVGLSQASCLAVVLQNPLHLQGVACSIGELE